MASGALLFTDPDHSDTHSFTITGVSTSGAGSGLPVPATVLSWLSLGTLTNSTDGATGSQEWTFSAAGESFDYLGDGQSVTLTYTVEVDDGHGGVATRDVTITITGTNDAPVITSNGGDATASVSVAENTTAVTTVQASDVDSPTRTYSIVTGLPDDGAKFTIDPDTGALSFITAPDYETPGSAAGSNDYTVQVQVSDGAGGVDVQTLTVNVTDVAENQALTGNVQLVSQASYGGAGNQAAADVSYANGHLYLAYNSRPELQSVADNSTIVSLTTGPGAPTLDFSQFWTKGFFNGIAADGTNIYAAGASNPAHGLTSDGSGGAEVKTLLAMFNTSGAAGSNPIPATDYAVNNFFSYRGVEMYQDVLVTTQGGDSVVYAVGHGQPNGASGAYVIASYDANGNLLHTATDPLASGFSIARDVVEFNGQIWAVGYTDHGEAIGRAVVWAADYDLSPVTTYKDTVETAPAAFYGAAVIGSNLYAVGDTSSGGNDYLVAKYNTNGTIAWSHNFGGTGRRR